MITCNVDFWLQATANEKQTLSRLRYRWGLELSVFKGVEIGCGVVLRMLWAVGICVPWPWAVGILLLPGHVSSGTLGGLVRKFKRFRQGSRPKAPCKFSTQPSQHSFACTCLNLHLVPFQHYKHFAEVRTTRASVHASWLLSNLANIFLSLSGTCILCIFYTFAAIWC